MLLATLFDTVTVSSPAPTTVPSITPQNVPSITPETMQLISPKNAPSPRFPAVSPSTLPTVPSDGPATVLLPSPPITPSKAPSPVPPTKLQTELSTKTSTRKRTNLPHVSISASPIELLAKPSTDGQTVQPVISAPVEPSITQRTLNAELQASLQIEQRNMPRSGRAIEKLNEMRPMLQNVQRTNRLLTAQFASKMKFSSDQKPAPSP
eukprot:IDg22513t1